MKQNVTFVRRQTFYTTENPKSVVAHEDHEAPRIKPYHHTTAKAVLFRAFKPTTVPRNRSSDPPPPHQTILYVPLDKTILSYPLVLSYLIP